MPSERVQRQIDRLLDEAEAAITQLQWGIVRDRAKAALALDAENPDAATYLSSAEHELGSSTDLSSAPLPTSSLTREPESFANGRYTVRKFLGEGGKKKVYLAHDSLLDRDVAFALIKTEGLDDAGRERIQREAQAMGRLGNHPNIVTVYDIGDENGQPYLVLPILSGGDVEGVIEKAPEHKLPLALALKIAIETCQGLELAHGKGIVHRDLKPGNVWLTEDGRAMIGDFGLAVAADRSRLTQAGMMVGTVSYMPPEQAMGSEVGPRSDLYSLGAMLYEMVCGRPPFVGDESVAIIGQHLNTPPVAPTWHRPDCPPALEALILRLLEKDPSRRPGSATEVREALASVNTSPRPSTVVEAVPSGGNDPLYRRTFVGRENEVKQLQAAFDGAMSGNGGLVMVVGEPGIGKTALCEQLATYVTLRGGKALVGHCYEEGSLSLPYLAFVEAMRSYVLAREPDGLRSDLGTGAADVARIVSEVRDRVQGVELRPAGDPDDDRWRLLQSVTSFLRNASTVQPLVIVLEDLHWADRGTLDLLLHVSRNLEGARLLIVGTYRDVEVDRSHPLSNAMGDLRRINNFSRIPLRGLTAEEVQRMMAAVAQRDIPWPLAELLHRQTEGSPLFVQEMLRYLVEEGLVAESEGTLRRVGDDTLAGRIPEGLRDVIGKRLTRLGPDANRLLATASVIGRDFRLDVLQRVAAMSEDDIITALEEAKSAAIVEERSSVGAVVTYRFSHAFFSQALYEEISAPRRIRLHQQVGRALEEVFARRLDEHAPELAEHFSHSSDPADLSKAVRYGELAAQRAMSVFDYGEAARLLERAIEVQEVFDPDDKSKRCDLLLALSEALMPAGEWQRVITTLAPEAFALAESSGDTARASRVCRVVRFALQREGGGATEGNPTTRLWAERGDRLAAPGTLDRVWADVALAREAMAEAAGEEHRRYTRRAIALAQELGDSDSTIYSLAMAQMLPVFSAELLNEINDLLPSFRKHLDADLVGVRIQTRAGFYYGCFRIFMLSGERDAAQQAFSKEMELATRSNDRLASSMHRSMEQKLKFMDGALAELVEEASIPAEAGFAETSGQALAIIAWFHTGGSIPPEPYAQSEGPLAQDAYLLAHSLWSSIAGNEKDAIENFRRYVEVGGGRKRPGVIATTLFLAVRLRLSDLVFEFYETAKSMPQLPGVNVWGVPHVLQTVMGDAASLLGLVEAAKQHYQDGLEVSLRMRHRPLIALTRLSLAELLLEHFPDEHETAIEHLDFAIGELRDMKMQPTLERALRHRGLLKA